MRPIRKQFFYLLGMLTVLSALSSALQAAPESELIEFWATSNEKSTASIDHSTWDKLLERYIETEESGVNLFAYGRVSSSDKEVLNTYLNELQALDPRKFSRKEQMAFWINLYNAATVKLILDNYPVKSITKISDSFFGFGPWDDELLNIVGQELTLNNIEHGILRPIWNDERIHYAVNCASYSCPNLSKDAFTADNTEQLLEQGAMQYINHPRGVSVYEDELFISSIYHWYLVDFGDSIPSLLSHLKKYASPALKQQLEMVKGDYEHDYDWSLNQP